MGSKLVRKEKVTMGEKEKNPTLYDIKKIYWDADGNLRRDSYSNNDCRDDTGYSERNRDEEVLQILEADTNSEDDPAKLWMIVPSRWIRLWLQFAYLKLGEPPGPIDMWSLLQKDPKFPGNWRPKATLQPPHSKFGEIETPGHYRRISLQAWLKLLDLYGIEGYALAVKGIPVDDLNRWRVFKDPKSIDAALLPDPVIPKEKEKKDSSVTSAAKSLASSFGLNFSSSTTPKDDKKK